jgi:hypothetical protein
MSYDPNVSSREPDAAVDAILRHVDAEASSVSIEVTLYLPWGVATGITVTSTYFGHYSANFFNRNDAGDVAGRIAALEASSGASLFTCAKPGVMPQARWQNMNRCASAYPMCPRGQSVASGNHQLDHRRYLSAALPDCGSGSARWWLRATRSSPDG